MQPLKGVLIDFDGTFVDTIQPLYGIYKQFLENFGVKGSLKEFQELNGPPLAQIVEILAERHALPEVPQVLLQQYHERLKTFYAQTARPFPGAVETILKWKKAGLAVALVTSAPQDLLQLFLKGQKLESLFTAVFTSDLVTQGKPDPALYLYALQALKLKADETLALEDSPNGLKAAVGASLFTLYLRPSHPKPKDLGLWREIRNWAEIEAWVVENYG